MSVHLPQNRTVWSAEKLVNELVRVLVEFNFKFSYQMEYALRK